MTTLNMVVKDLAPMSAEASVVRNYIDTLIGLPWQKKTKISRELALAEKILDEDHYGLEKVKERILEHLAVLKLTHNLLTTMNKGLIVLSSIMGWFDYIYL